MLACRSSSRGSRLARWLVAALVLATSALAAAQAEPPATPAPQSAVQAAASVVTGNPFLAAAIATGLAAIGAGIAVGIAGAAAIGAIAERPELLGRSLIFVGLAEGIVIYGLIVSFIILGAR
ncbi:MAG: ATP synthase subunit C [Deinococcales bacterium]|jgi:V/A-type H+/Na+-transporting ATPase subunit K